MIPSFDWASFLLSIVVPILSVLGVKASLGSDVSRLHFRVVLRDGDVVHLWLSFSDSGTFVLQLLHSK